MNDMSGVITPKSDQINADDLIAGPRTILVREVDIRPGTEQPVSIFYEGDTGKPWRPCKSMSRVLVAAWGPDAKQYTGRSITLYRDPSVKWGGLEVGGIRISHLSHIEREMVMALTATKGKRSPYTVRVLTPAASTAAPELTLAQARANLEGAFDLDDLRAIWSRKVMAPFRADLQTVLDERKAALTTIDGPADTDRGEAHSGTNETHPRRARADEMIGNLSVAKNGEGVEAMASSFAADLALMPDEMQIEVETAIKQARARFS